MRRRRLPAAVPAPGPAGVVVSVAEEAVRAELYRHIAEQVAQALAAVDGEADG